MRCRVLSPDVRSQSVLNTDTSLSCHDLINTHTEHRLVSALIAYYCKLIKTLHFSIILWILNLANSKQMK